MTALFANGNPRPDCAAHLEPAIVEQVPALIGRDPRRLTVSELEALGHTKQPLLRVTVSPGPLSHCRGFSFAGHPPRRTILRTGRLRAAPEGAERSS
jgi:hypothetical protein